MEKHLKKQLYEDILKYRGTKGIFDICKNLGIDDKVAQSEVPYLLMSVAVTSLEQVEKLETLKTLSRDDIVEMMSMQIESFRGEINKAIKADDTKTAISISKVLTPLFEKYTKLEGFNMAELFQIDDKRSIDLSKLDILELKALEKIIKKANPDNIIDGELNVE